MAHSRDRASVESRHQFEVESRQLETDDYVSTSGITFQDAQYACSTCGSCGAVVLAWGVVSNETREDLPATTVRVVWVLLLLIVFATSAYLVESVEASKGVMRPNRGDGMPQKYTSARIMCAGLGVVNVLGLLYGLITNEFRDSYSKGTIRTGWVCFFVMWLISTFNFVTTMMTTPAQPEASREITTNNPARQARPPPPRPPSRSSVGPTRQSVEGLTSLDRNSLSRDSLDEHPFEGSLRNPVEPTVVLSSIREERAHRRSTSQESFTA